MIAPLSQQLFQSQLRPYLVVPSLKQTPSGLGLDQYKGLTRYISTSSSAGNEETTAAEVDGLVMCSEKGYTANEVKSLLEKISPGVLKRVVMLSSVGVNRREDFMLKLRQYPINLDERVGRCFIMHCLFRLDHPLTTLCLLNLHTPSVARRRRRAHECSCPTGLFLHAGAGGETSWWWGGARTRLRILR